MVDVGTGNQHPFQLHFSGLPCYAEAGKLNRVSQTVFALSILELGCEIGFPIRCSYLRFGRWK